VPLHASWLTSDNRRIAASTIILQLVGNSKFTSNVPAPCGAHELRSAASNFDASIPLGREVNHALHATILGLPIQLVPDCNLAGMIQRSLKSLDAKCGKSGKGISLL
jgi:hypothetical protein